MNRKTSSKNTPAESPTTNGPRKSIGASTSIKGNIPAKASQSTLLSQKGQSQTNLLADIQGKKRTTVIGNNQGTNEEPFDPAKEEEKTASSPSRRLIETRTSSSKNLKSPSIKKSQGSLSRGNSEKKLAESNRKSVTSFERSETLKSSTTSNVNKTINRSSTSKLPDNILTKSNPPKARHVESGTFERKKPSSTTLASKKNKINPEEEIVFEKPISTRLIVAPKEKFAQMETDSWANEEVARDRARLRRLESLFKECQPLIASKP